MALNVRRVGQKLPHEFSCNVHNYITWKEAMRLGKRDKILGEIRTEADLKKVPKNVLLRAVYMPDGSLRWADSSKMTQIFAYAQHDYLACSDDPKLPTRQGYIMVDSKGKLTVSDGSY